MSENPPPLTRLIAEINGVIRGKPEVVELALTAVLARGHLLLEDVPGVGKTTLAHAIAVGLGCTFKRIQFTSDLLPSDILGVNIFDQSVGSFEFRPGPIFANVVLADEINRTTPKTQSSLLEAMNEGQVSIDNDTRRLPKPFIVIATQNPQEYHGTYPLPESQMDRFMMRLRMGYPPSAVEREILRERRGGVGLDGLRPQLTAQGLLELQRRVDDTRVDDSVLDYIVAVVEATRRSPALDLGVSTRGALALQHAARAHALVTGRGYVLPDDVKQLATHILAHRVIVAGGTDGLLRSREDAERTIAEIVEQIPVPV